MAPRPDASRRRRHRHRAAWIAASAVAVLLAALLRWSRQPALPPPPLPSIVEGSASAPAATETAVPDLPAPTPVEPPVEMAVVASGARIRLLRRPRFVLPRDAFLAEYQRLLPLAEAGDAPSQHALGSLLYECREIPVDAAALDAEVESIHQTRRRGRWTVDSPAAEVATLRHAYQRCAGIPAEARAGFRDWLHRAADAGLVEAQLALPMKLPPADYCQYLAECAPGQRELQQALQAEAIDYTTRAREAGSVAALWTIAGWHAGGEVLPQNDVEAYAHFLALDQIHAVAKLTPRFERLLTDLRSRLRPVDLDTAEARAAELLANPACCVITP